MADRPQPDPQPMTPAPVVEAPRRIAEPREKRILHVTFTAYPKLLYVWPLIVAGFAFWPVAGPSKSAAPLTASSSPQIAQSPATTPGASQPAASLPVSSASLRLERLGWVYIWIALLVVLALGVDLGRNQALVLLLFIAFVWVLGILLRDKYQFTLFGDVYRWFGAQNVQYDRSLGLCLSILLAVPYVLVVAWARVNNHWRITPNEFEHYSFGRSSESLGRGAKSIKSEFPDFFEAVLGFGAGTLIVCDANGLHELRRIPNILFLPIVRKKIYDVLERTAVTEAPIDDVVSEDHQ
jgi:hypothetical protein